MEAIKQPASIWLGLQVFLVPIFAVLLALFNEVQRENTVLQLIIFHGASALIVHLSNIHAAVLARSTVLFAMLLLGVVLLLGIFPFNYFALHIPAERELMRGPVCVFLSSILMSISHFPGAQSLVESQNMVQMGLLSLMFLEEHGSRLARQQCLQEISHTQMLIDLSVALLLAGIPTGLFALLAAKSWERVGRKLHAHVIFAVSAYVCGFLVLKAIGTRCDYFQQALRYRPSASDALALRDCCFAIALFVIFKSVVFGLVNGIAGINIHYNHIHRTLYQAFTRKSYHVLMIGFSWATENTPYLFYLISAVALFALCYIEALRPHNSILSLFFKYTQSFVTDTQTQTAINHIELLVSTTLFPALAYVTGRHNSMLKCSSLVTVLVADAIAQMMPALTLLLIKREVPSWVDVMHQHILSVPLYQGWTMPNIEQDAGFIHDLELLTKPNTHAHDLFLHARMLGGNSSLDENNIVLHLPNAQGSLKILKTDLFCEDEFLFLFRRRTPLGSFSYAVSQWALMSYFGVNIIVAGIISIGCAAYELIGECDNCIAPVVCGLLLIIFRAS